MNALISDIILVLRERAEHKISDAQTLAYIERRIEDELARDDDKDVVTYGELARAYLTHNEEE